MGRSSFRQCEILCEFDKMNVGDCDFLMLTELIEHTFAHHARIVGMIEKQGVKDAGADKLRIFMNVNLVHKDQTNSFRSFIAFDIQTIVPFVL